MRKSFLISIIGEALPDDWVVRMCLPMQEMQKETQVPSLGQEDPLEEEMETHSSIFAWEIQRVAKNSDWTCMHVMSFDHCIQPYSHFSKVPSHPFLIDFFSISLP